MVVLPTSVRWRRYDGNTIINDHRDDISQYLRFARLFFFLSVYIQPYTCIILYITVGRSR